MMGETDEWLRVFSEAAQRPRKPPHQGEVEKARRRARRRKVSDV